MHVVVVSCSHRGDDARIIHRQAKSFLLAGHRVTAVISDPGSVARAFDPVGLERVSIRRAIGRRRVRAWREARRAVANLGADFVIVHDLELVPWIPRKRGQMLVLDIHEDFVALVNDTTWIPRPLRILARTGVRLVESVARKRWTIVLAEEAYQQRFGECPVVPNTTWVDETWAPVDEPLRVVYVGRLSADRGVHDMIAIGRRLRERGGPQLVLVGAADAECRAALETAHREGVVHWRGPLANPDALNVVRGALVGLSLLHDVPNYVVSRPTKLMEYMAVGVPVVSTPLPLAAEMVRAAESGHVTEAWSGEALIDEVVDIVTRLLDDPERRRIEGQTAWIYARDSWNWNQDGQRFVSLMERLAGAAR
ncbi:MAG: glycosyltransferase family 4 protein [Ilumatobacteraceae bacterium]